MAAASRWLLAETTEAPSLVVVRVDSNSPKLLKHRPLSQTTSDEAVSPAVMLGQAPETSRATGASLTIRTKARISKDLVSNRVDSSPAIARVAR
jgi:hypothetical protein